MSVYIGVDGTARKAKKMYVGVSDVARKVKKAYVGVNGVARLFFAAEKKVVYHGTGPNLSIARSYACGASNGQYALIAGGYDGSSARYANVDCYDTNLVRSTVANLSNARGVAASATVSDYMLFAGGYNNSGNSDVVDCYNTALTKVNVASLALARDQFAGGSVGDYAIFAGSNVYDRMRRTVDAYDGKLQHHNLTTIVIFRRQLGAASAGEFLLVAGGINVDNSGATYSATVNVINQSLTLRTAPDLSVARGNLVGVSVGDYALFCGGNNGSKLDVVDAYNSALTRSLATPLQCTQSSVSKNATALDDFALISGGNANDSSITTCYNGALTRITVAPTSRDDSARAAATIGDFALFAGGGNRPVTAVVDVYTLE